MNLFRVSLAGVRARPLESTLNVILMGLGVGTIVLLLLIASQLDARMKRDARGVDLVVGAKGSPLQLILSAVYQIDIPTGNITLEEAGRLAHHPMIKRAIPISMGDSFGEYRIVGAAPDYLALYGATLAAGALWGRPMEAVLGAEAARRSGLKLGGTFSGSHGLTPGGQRHEEEPYRVVGVLAPTGTIIDRLVVTDLASVWQVHEHGSAEPAPADSTRRAGREVTALLVQYRTAAAAALLPRMINKTTNMMAAAPAFELARLLNVLGAGIGVLRAFGAVFILIAALSLFVGLYNALEARRFDVAILRTLGATRGQVFRTILAEGLVVAGLGTLLGLLLGHGAAQAVGAWSEANHQIPLDGWIWVPAEWGLVGLALLVGFLSAVVPAWRAYRSDIAETLAKAG